MLPEQNRKISWKVFGFDKILTLSLSGSVLMYPWMKFYQNKSSLLFLFNIGLQGGSNCRNRESVTN